MSYNGNANYINECIHDKKWSYDAYLIYCARNMEQGDDYVQEQVDGMFKTFYCDMIDDCDIHKSWI